MLDHVEPAGDAYLVSLSFGLAEALRYVLREHHNVRASRIPLPGERLWSTSGPLSSSSNRPKNRSLGASLLT